MAPPAPSSPLASWTAAASELRSAERLIAKDATSLRDVAQHLRGAWVELHRNAGAVASVEDSDGAVAEFARAVHDPVLGGETAARDLVFGSSNDDASSELDAEPALREGLAREAAVLRRAIYETGLRRDGSAWVSLALCFGVVLLLALAPLIGDLGGTVTTPWRGQYFNNDAFEGKPREHFDRILDFDFGRESPRRGIDKDRFSIRWDTCLILDEDTDIRFELTSDDGSRLHVDGEEVVDNWGDHGTKSKVGRTSLEAGVHYLEVEYYEAKHGANVKLEAAIGAESMGMIPLEILQMPVDGDDPCAGDL